MGFGAVHGGDVERVARKYGVDPSEILDFSANINPTPLPVETEDYLLKSLKEVDRYPDREYRRLRGALSRYSGVNQGNIMVGNGATELLYLTARALKVSRVLLPVPSFAEYERALTCVQADITYFPLKEEEGFSLNIDRLMKELSRGYDLIILCNPNNPTGQLIQWDDMMKILEKCQRQETVLLLDETFIEFTPQPQERLFQEISPYPNVILIRALTKFFGIPGLRLGYCLANSLLLEKLWAQKEPWTVNIAASMVGAFLLENGDFIQRSREWIKEERPFMTAKLQEIPGFRVYQSCANFILLKLLQEGWTSSWLKERLEERRILIRDASSFPGLDSSFIRIAIKDRENNLKLLQVLESLRGRTVT